MSELLGSWIDGAPADRVPIDDRGLQYGDGLFETMLVRHGRVRFIDAHLARLALGCTRLAIPFEVGAALRAEIAATSARAPALAILKLIVTRGSGPRRGYPPAAPVRPRRLLSLFAVPPVPPMDEGVDVRLAALTVAENPALAGIKHLNRLENVLAASEAGHATVFESLLRNPAGQVIGGTMTNVFAVQSGRVTTPRVERCGVAGVMRAIVLRECAALGIDAGEADLALADLLGADEVFVTNARIGVVPVRRVGEHSFPMQTIARRLGARIETLDA
ncbi:MAG TPA: aminodeoxychorismate lyase [Steroidobacteraceae bacterium]|jgi:4-amino-4-deoxychorismate lyase|nr:aminodeoxychorismate lyase [Steroidobacteraceae bacterium]